MKDELLRMRKKERANILQRIEAWLAAFGSKHQDSRQLRFVQLQVDWVKSGGTRNDRILFKGALHIGKGC